MGGSWGGGHVRNKFVLGRLRVMRHVQVKMHSSRKGSDGDCCILWISVVAFHYLTSTKNIFPCLNHWQRTKPPSGSRTRTPHRSVTQKMRQTESSTPSTAASIAPLISYVANRDMSLVSGGRHGPEAHLPRMPVPIWICQLSSVVALFKRLTCTNLGQRRRGPCSPSARAGGQRLSAESAEDLPVGVRSRHRKSGW